MSWIEWCKCGSRILTTEQVEKGQDCYDCQKEHATKFKDKIEELQKEG